MIAWQRNSLAEGKLIFGLKLITACLIMTLTLVTGRLAIHALNRHRTGWQISDAFADGIFIGIACFHLLPNAYHTLGGQFNVLLELLGLTGLGYLILFLLTRIRHHHNAWFLLAILSMHSLITGSVLGISYQFTDLLLVAIAIFAHKGFETFALITGLRRYWRAAAELNLSLIIFSAMTPLGILLGGTLQHYMVDSAHTMDLNYLNAIAAGTLIFIATTHKHGHSHDVLKKYQELMFTVAGIGLMALLGFWI